jgi:hypothetical protein
VNDLEPNKERKIDRRIEAQKVAELELVVSLTCE